jgi:hypothetical protein
VIYLDSSVVLAQLLAEDRRPPEALWREDLVSSRLLEYEVWTCIHSRGLADRGQAAARQALAEIYLIGLTPAVLRRALEPFPLPLRTLDALHLATVEYLRERGRSVQLASYDQRLLATAAALNVATAPL